jgi:O-antigen ligase
VTFGVWIMKKISKREKWLGTKNLLPALLFIFLALLSSFWARRPEVAIDGVFTLAQLLALSLLVADLVRIDGKMEAIIKSLLLGGVVAATLTVSQYYAGAMRAGNQIAGNVNKTGLILTVIVPLAFYMLLTSKSFWWRLISVLYIGIGSLAILYTFSRTAYAVFALILLIYVTSMLKSSGRARVRILVAGMIGIIVIVNFSPLDQIIERSSSMAGYLSATGKTADTRGERVFLWWGGWEIFKDYPIFGVGYGNFGYYFLTYQFKVPANILQAQKSFDLATIWSPHSTLFGMLAELGFVGTGLWFRLQLIPFQNLNFGRWLRLDGARSDRDLLLQALFFCLLAYLIFTLGEVTQNHKLLWLLFGLSEIPKQDLPVTSMVHPPYPKYKFDRRSKFNSPPLDKRIP